MRPVAVTRERYAGKKWQRFSNYAFASKSASVPVSFAELARVALAIPMAFVGEGGRFALVAVLSPTPGSNMFVGPDGRWLGSYVPACFRSYPFLLQRQPDTDQAILCIDADSGLVLEGGSTGEDFFDPDGNLAPVLTKVLEFTSELERGRKVCEMGVSALAEAGVIQPWPIRLTAGQADRAVTGLHRVDQTAFNALADDAFLKLRKSSALPIAYAQMLSTVQLGIFERLAKLQTELTPSQAAAVPENLDSVFAMSNNDLIQFR
jgi:hypothetical protein